MIQETYAVVMDPKKNPLANLPRMVTFQLMTLLSWMWSIVFSFWLGSLAIFGPSVAVHTILLIGIFFTAGLFASARKQRQAEFASKAPSNKTS